jgi:hypothetical protein
LTLPRKMANSLSVSTCSGFDQSQPMSPAKSRRLPATVNSG